MFDARPADLARGLRRPLTRARHDHEDVREGVAALARADVDVAQLPARLARRHGGREGRGPALRLVVVREQLLRRCVELVRDGVDGLDGADHAAHDGPATNGGDGDDHKGRDPGRVPRRHGLGQEPKEHDQRRRQGEHADDELVARLEDRHDQREETEVDFPLRARQRRYGVRRHEPLPQALGTEAGLVAVEIGAELSLIHISEPTRPY